MNNENLPAPVTASERALAPWTQGEKYETLKSLANTFASSQLVPKKFQGKPFDCFIAVQLADRAGIDPFLALQNLNVIDGQPSWKTTFAMGLTVTQGHFASPIEFEIASEGENLKVTALAKLASTGREVKATASMEMARIEGWTKNSKYRSMPEQMLCYRAATFLIRRNAPGVLAGMPVAEELEDARDVSPKSGTVDKLNEKIRAAKAPTGSAEAVTASVSATRAKAQSDGVI